jgi:hypothetical protein
MERDYSAEWVALLTNHRPELADTEAQVLVDAAHTVVGLLSRRRDLRQRPGLSRELTGLARAVLGLSGSI